MRSRRQIFETVAAWLIVAAVFGAVAAAWRTGSLQELELIVYDALVRLNHDRKPANEPVTAYLAIGDDYLKERAVPSVTDQDLAIAIEKLTEAGAVAIGLDVVRSFAVEPGVERLARVLRETPSVYGIIFYDFDDESHRILTPAHSALPSSRWAIYNLLDDEDGAVRRATLFVTAEGTDYPTLGYVLAEEYLLKHGVEIGMASDGVSVQIGKAVFTPIGPHFGGYVGYRRIDSDGDGRGDGYQFTVRYTQPKEALSLLDLIEGRIGADAFRDRIVLIGYAGHEKKDMIATPIDPLTEGTEVHATIAEQIVDAAMGGVAPMGDWPEAAEVTLLLAAVMGGGAVGYWIRSPWLLVGAAVAGLGVLIGGAVWLYGRGVWVPVVPSTLGLVVSGAAVTSYQRYRERQDRMVLMGLFGRHVSDQVAQTIWQQRDEILTSGRLKTEDLVATVLFTDLQGFTSVAEHLGPQGTVAWLNQYLDRMGKLIIAHNGMINKFMGDAIMALFGVPLRRQTQDAIDADACAAVACAVAMREALEPLNADLKQRGLPEITLRAGVFTGPLVAGSVGSTDRIEYTVIGDSVNVAARLEAYDKDRMGDLAPRNCRVLIGEETLRRLGDAFETRFVGQDEVHNRNKPVRIFAVLACRGTASGPTSKKGQSL